jgi:hypothetical protein
LLSLPPPYLRDRSLLLLLLLPSDVSLAPRPSLLLLLLLSPYLRLASPRPLSSLSLLSPLVPALLLLLL